MDPIVIETPRPLVQPTPRYGSRFIDWGTGGAHSICAVIPRGVTLTLLCPNVHAPANNTEHAALAPVGGLELGRRFVKPGDVSSSTFGGKRNYSFNNRWEDAGNNRRSGNPQSANLNNSARSSQLFPYWAATHWKLTIHHPSLRIPTRTLPYRPLRQH